MSPAWSQGEAFIDGAALGPIESFSFETFDTLRTETDEAVAGVLLGPNQTAGAEGSFAAAKVQHEIAASGYGFSATLLLSKRAGRRLSRMFDTAAPLRQLRHVRRGCGPGGHRNSRLSRRLERALLPVAVAHMIAQQHAEREALRRQYVAAQARAMEQAVQRDIDARVERGAAPTFSIDTEGSKST